MTPEQQRIAIAEACGWIYRPEHDVEFNTPAGRVAPESWRIDYPNGDCEAACFDGLPDYLNDLNAMHEAEKLILNYDAGSHGRYIDHLIDVCGKRKDETWHLAIFHATASQRAEAFLRTLNLWTHET